MFGYLRFALALLVLLSHVGVRVEGLNPGVIAVVVFYILAGFVVSNLYQDVLPNSPYKTLYLYKNRIARVFPLYLYAMLLTIAFLIATSYGNPHFSFTKVLSNALIVPLNYYMYIDNSILTEPKWWLIPPAWSLGAELQAYMALPLVFLFKRLRVLLALISLTLYIAANFSLIHPDHFGYRLPFGVFFIFMAGSALHASGSSGNHDRDRFDFYYPPFVWLLILVLLLICVSLDAFSPAYAKETFMGILIGLPLVALLSRKRYRLPYDKTLGRLSYGVFLTHFLSIWILDFLGLASQSIALQVLYVASLSLVFSMLGLPLEKLFRPKAKK